MRLLLDQNLSPRLVGLLSEPYPDSLHVRDLGLARAGDAAVWRAAIERDLVLVSKDADFHQRSFVVGPPPKVVWVRVGNCTTEEIAILLRARAPDVQRFLADPDASFLALG